MSRVSIFQIGDDISQNYYSLYYFMRKKWGKMDNTVLGYKKGSKLNSKVGFATATTKLYMVIFVTFLKKVVSHSSKYR